MFGFSLVSGELLCPHIWSNNFLMNSKLFPFNCYHAYAYAFNFSSETKNYNVALAIKG